MTSKIQDGCLPLILGDRTLVDLGSILRANHRTLIYHAPDPPLLARPSSSNFFTTAFSFAIRALGIDAENFFQKSQKYFLQRLIKQCQNSKVYNISTGQYQSSAGLFGKNIKNIQNINYCKIINGSYRCTW